MNRKYTVVFVQRISNFHGAGCFLRRVFALPFVPCVGMEISCGDWSCLIHQCNYAIDTEEFRCSAEPDMETHGEPHPSIEEIVAGYLAEGWENASPC